MIVLKSENGDFIFLDVVTQYSRSFNSGVSSHPVDGSGIVSDHVIKQNPRIQLVGLISGADFNVTKPSLTAEDRELIGIRQVVDPNAVATSIEVSYENNALNLFPDVAGQFFSDTLPEIERLREDREAAYSEKVLLEVLVGFHKNKRKLTMYEFDRGVVVDTQEDVFITSLNINETATNGDALSFDITLEKVTFSFLLESELPEDVQEDFRKKAEEEEKKGGQGTVDATGEPRTSDIRSAAAASLSIGD